MTKDQAQFEYTFDAIHGDLIHQFEVEHSIQLPEQYKNFLLKNNGGKTGLRKRFITKDPFKEGEVESSIRLFLPLLANAPNHLEEKYQFYTEKSIIDKNFLPIGLTPRESIICMSLGGNHKGAVYHFNMNADDYISKCIPVEEDQIRLIDKSFNEFLNNLFVAE